MMSLDIYSDQYPGPSKRAKKTVDVETTKVLLKVGTGLFRVECPKVEHPVQRFGHLSVKLKEYFLKWKGNFAKIVNWLLFLTMF